MAKPGPLPKPTALKLIEGNPGKRPVPKGEPRPLEVAPELPTWLPGRARDAWIELAPELERLGLLTAIDGPAFAAACITWGMAREAAEEIRIDGVTDFDEHNGRLRKHPATQVLRDNLAAYRQWCAEFGLTPAARARLATNHDDSGFDPLLD
jgi:P27 family predicted phage terminase small subunit